MQRAIDSGCDCEVSMVAMGKKRKSWQEKLQDNKGLPQVCPIDASKSKRWGTGTFVIPAPLEVDALMRQVPKGKVTTIDEMRRFLAKRHGATIGCPITTGIFAWIAAHAAAEARTQGRKRITPYWRVLKAKGEINPKYPGGLEDVGRLLRAEGHKVVRKRQRFFVEDFDKSLAALK